MTAEPGSKPGRQELSAPIECALRDALDRRDIGSVSHKPYYLQWTARTDEVVVAEAVSNRYLDWEHRLRPHQRRALLVLGWEARDGASPNYQYWNRDLHDLCPLANLLVATWCDVFGLSVRCALRDFARTARRDWARVLTELMAKGDES